MKIKCKLKYFWNGFSNPFHFNSIHLCPYCCGRISEKEFNDVSTLSFGCWSCGNTEDKKEFGLFGWDEELLKKAEEKIKELN